MGRVALPFGEYRWGWYHVKGVLRLVQVAGLLFGVFSGLTLFHIPGNIAVILTELANFSAICEKLYQRLTLTWKMFKAILQIFWKNKS